MKINLEKMLRIKMGERKGSLSGKIDIETFYDDFLAIILDYLSLDIYKVSSKEVLVNDLEYLCNTLEECLPEEERREYFKSLLIQTVSSYNAQGLVNIMWYPALENGKMPVMEVMSSMYCYKTGLKGLEKENFIMLLQYMANLDLGVVKVDERDSDKLRQYIKSE